MGWPIGAMPPAGGSLYALYQWVQQFPAAIREKQGVNGFGPMACDYAWPSGSWVWASGKVSSIDDNGDGTLTINCKVWDAETETWADPDWISARHPGMPTDTKWWTGYGPPLSPAGGMPWEPTEYKVAIFPKGDVVSGGYPGDPAYGHSLDIADNGDATLKVNDDGVLTLNQPLSAYDDYRFHIIRQGSGTQDGYAWHMRYPPRPNGDTLEFGKIGKVYTITPSGTEDPYVVTVNGTATGPLPKTTTAPELESAVSVAAGGTVGVKVTLASPGVFTVAFDSSLGTVTVTATEATATAEPNKIGMPSRNWTANEWGGKSAIFAIGNRWKRVTVSSSDAHTLTLPSAAGTIGTYFCVVESASVYWRPHFYAGGPQFRVEIDQVQMRTAVHPVWQNYTYWSPQIWYATMALKGYDSHAPTDALGSYGVPANVWTIKESQDPDADCEQYQPLGVKEDVNPHDQDAHLLVQNFCTEDADKLLSPWFHWSLRGWQLDALSMTPFWLVPETFGGLTRRPQVFNAATWYKYSAIGHNFTVTITGVTSGVAHFSAVTLPKPTPLSATPTNYAECAYALLNADGSVKSSGSGTLTSTSFTASGLYSFDDGSADADLSDVGLSLVVGLGFTRKHERRVQYLYPRTGFMPSLNFDLEYVYPPTEEDCGEYVTHGPSATYAEYDKYGRLESSGTAFIENESARYVGDSYEHPTQMGEYEDICFQGVTDPHSDFPKFVLSGTATDGGNFWLEDAENLFWAGASPIATHTGTGGSGGSTNVLRADDQYKEWPTTVGTPPDTTTEMQLRLSNFFTSQGGARFVGMILEVAVSGAGTTEDPYVWERRPITAQNVSTPSAPTLTVSPAFSATTVNKPYKIREGGSHSRGALINTFKGRPLVITKADGTKHTVTITHSDDVRLYWATSEGVLVAAGDTYKIDQIEAGNVVHRKGGVAHSHNGWVKPEQATQDARGHDWFVNATGMLQNCPTIVTTYGLLRKGDVIMWEYFKELYDGLNAMHWKLFEGSWVNRGECNVASWPGDDQTLYADSLPSCNPFGPKDCTAPGHSGFAWCDYAAAYNRATTVYEGCEEGCVETETCIIPPQNGPPEMRQPVRLDMGESCVPEGGCASEPITFILGCGEIFRKHSYYDGQVLCCWDSGLTVQSYAKATPPGGLPSGTTVLTFQTDPAVPCLDNPTGKIEVSSTNHVTFKADGTPFAEGVYTLFQTKTTDAEGNYVGDRVGPADVTTKPSVPARPTPDPYTYDAGLGCGCRSGLHISTRESGFEVNDDYTVCDYNQKFHYQG